MPDENMQHPIAPITPQRGEGELSNDDLAAALGFITTISENHLKQQAAQQPEVPTEAPQSPETAPTAPQEAEPPKDLPDLQPEIDALKTQFDGLKADVEKLIKDELVSVKDMIKEVLTKDEQEQTS